MLRELRRRYHAWVEKDRAAVKTALETGASECHDARPRLVAVGRRFLLRVFFVTYACTAAILVSCLAMVGLQIARLGAGEHPLLARLVTHLAWQFTWRMSLAVLAALGAISLGTLTSLWLGDQLQDAVARKAEDVMLPDQSSRLRYWRVNRALWPSDRRLILITLGTAVAVGAICIRSSERIGSSLMLLALGSVALFGVLNLLHRKAVAGCDTRIGHHLYGPSRRGLNAVGFAAILAATLTAGTGTVFSIWGGTHLVLGPATESALLATWDSFAIATEALMREEINRRRHDASLPAIDQSRADSLLAEMRLERQQITAELRRDARRPLDAISLRWVVSALAPAIGMFCAVACVFLLVLPTIASGNARELLWAGVTFAISQIVVGILSALFYVSGMPWVGWVAGSVFAVGIALGVIHVRVAIPRRVAAAWTAPGDGRERYLVKGDGWSFERVADRIAGQRSAPTALLRALARQAEDQGDVGMAARLWQRLIARLVGRRSRIAYAEAIAVVVHLRELMHEDVWDDYVRGLVTRNRRKRKLIELLQREVQKAGDARRT